MVHTRGYRPWCRRLDSFSQRNLRTNGCYAIPSLAQTVYLMRLKGVTTFGWSVTTFTPLVVALIGSSIWMEWSDNIVSWELGISMIALASLSMWLSLRANSGIIFSVVAVTSGLLPLLYEYNNEDVGNGGAISLLVFIIAVQGTLLQTDVCAKI